MAKTRKVGVKSKAKSAPLVRFLKNAAVVVVIVTTIGAALGVSYLRSSVESVEPMVDNMGDKIQLYNSKPSKILSADGKILYEIRPIYRESVSLNQVPKHTIKAFLAAEDKSFYSHDGVDYRGLMRASVNFMKEKAVSGGGSTIPMQLAKRLFSASEVTMKRKVQDIAIAIQMEKKFTKDEILEIYLNQVYYGEQAYGIGAAAEIYFGKKVEDLTLSESAMLARCVRLPSTENPVKDYSRALENMKIVLGVMKDEGWITNQDYEQAIKDRPKIAKKEGKQSGKIYAAPYFTNHVLSELRSRSIPIAQGGYTVTTTLDLQLQNKAEEAVKRVVRWNRGRRVNTGAFIACDSEGRILVDVGGVSYRSGGNKLSRTTWSRMQPGSSFKPFVYAEALQEGLLDEYSSVSNAKIVIKQGRGRPDYVARNSHGGTGGNVSLWSAFTQSINLPAMHTLKAIGIKRAANLIKEDFGFQSKLDPVITLALGAEEVRPIEMLEAYSVFMLDGKRVKPYAIKEVTGPDGSIILQGGTSYSNTRIKTDAIRVVDKLMRGVVTSGTGRAAGAVEDAHGKTGTTNEGKDVWFCGYAKGIVGISWAGSEYYNKKRNQWLQNNMPSSYGGEVSAPMWAEVMKELLPKYGSDVRPDFRAKGADQTERRRIRKPEEDNVNNNEEDVPAINPNSPESNDPDPVDPRQDPASTDNSLPKETSTTPKPTIPKEPKTQPKTGNDDEMVTVEVCADSGQLAGTYCPETVSREVSKKKRPRGKCKVHKAPEEGGDGR